MRSASSLALALALCLGACETQDIVLGTDQKPGTDTGFDSGAASDTTAAGDPGAATDPGMADDPGSPGDPGVATDPGVLKPDPGGETVLVCTANNDGRIDAAELPVAIGAAPSYRVNAAGTQVDADPDGTLVEGERVWDFRDLPGDDRVPMPVDAPAGRWFADAFPDATFVSPLYAQDTSVLAVYRAEAGAVYLLGVASAEKDPPAGRTLVVYGAPVPLFSFPIEPGRTWTVETTFKDAVIAGLPNAGKEVYTFTVDGPGAVQLPDMTVLGCLRMKIETEQTFVVSTSPGPISSLQYLFLHECIGEVARLIGPVGVSPWNGKAREARYLGL